MRAEGDYWVVAKKSDRREFYVIMNQKNANLSEISGKTVITAGIILNLSTNVCIVVYILTRDVLLCIRGHEETVFISV